MTPDRLVKAAKTERELASIQRLGYLLDYLKEKKLSEALYKWAKNRKLSSVPLMPTRKLSEKRAYNAKWAIIINEEIEVDQ
jgi:predicted transcriptional regulator of viral defense system